jgi:hypothetical protein
MALKVFPEDYVDWAMLSGNSPQRILRFAEESNTKWSAFNPSVAYSKDLGFWVLFRSSNYFLDPATTSAVLTTDDNRVRTRLWMAQLNQSLSGILEETLVELDYSNAGIELKRGPEDGRLYWVEDHWEFTAGLKEPSVELPRIGRFSINGSSVSLLEIYNSGNLYDVEKNWVTTSDGSGDFDYIYNPVSVYKNGIGPVSVRDDSFGVRDVRGGTQLVPVGNGEYLSVIHEVVVREVKLYIPRYFGYKNVKIRKYLHRFAKYSKTGKIIGLSDRFVFTGARIEFAAGLVLDKDHLYVSYGHQDVASYIAKIELKKVMEMIYDV